MKSAISMSEKGYKGVSRAQSSLTLVDLNDFKSSNFLTKIASTIKTRTVLNQSEGVFVDFSRKTFLTQSMDIYDEFVDAYETRNKLELMKLCSFPFHQVSHQENSNLTGDKIVTQNLKNPSYPLPFTLYKEVVDAELVQARIFSHDIHNFNSIQTWHQMTMKFQVKDEETGDILEKYNVFERRESDNDHRLWKICHLDR